MLLELVGRKLDKKHHLAQKRSNGAAAPVPPARRDAISALRTRPQEASSCDDPAFGEFAKRCRLIQWRRERLEEPLELGAPEIDVCNERRMLGSICHQLEGEAGHGLVSTTSLRQDRKSTRLNSSH